MKKNFLLLTLLLFITMQSALGQLTDRSLHLYGRYSAGNVQSTFYSAYSFNAEFFVHRNIGLNYNFDWLERKDDLRQIHASMGILGGPILLASGFSNVFDGDSTSSGVFGILGGLVLLALPDGVSFHYSPSYNWDISPYANVLGLDFIKNRNSGETFIKYACSFGLKSTYLLAERFTITAFFETRQAAKFGWGYGGGLGLGIVLGDREGATE